MPSAPGTGGRIVVPFPRAVRWGELGIPCSSTATRSHYSPHILIARRNPIARIDKPVARIAVELLIPEPRRSVPRGGDDARAIRAKGGAVHGALMAAEDLVTPNSRLGRGIVRTLGGRNVGAQDLRLIARFLVFQPFQRQQRARDGQRRLDRLVLCRDETYLVSGRPILATNSTDLCKAEHGPPGAPAYWRRTGWRVPH